MDRIYIEYLNIFKTMPSLFKTLNQYNNIDVSDFCNAQTSYLHIDKEMLMQSASLKAQKSKTIIFLLVTHVTDCVTLSDF